jgi:anti-anti-sigma regulatory factor
MIKVDYDCGKNLVIIELSGDVDAAQARLTLLELERDLENVEKGFRVLVDFAAVETMEPEVEGVVLKAMDFLNAKGIEEIVRVLPDPEMELGFRLMSFFHYSPQVRVLAARTRAEGEALLREKIKG